MQVAFLTLFPDIVSRTLSMGVVGRAIERGLLDVMAFNPRDYTTDNYRTVDDRPFGGGPGMVMMIDPLKRALDAARLRLPGAPAILTSPHGRRFDQSMARRFAEYPAMILVCGRYEGIDQRFIDAHIDEEVSLGDFVTSGGELPAMTMVDAAARLLPGVLHDDQSAIEDSFMDGLLDCPHYTRPPSHPLGDVPPVLLSGNHGAIAQWRRQQSLGITWLRRPDLMSKLTLNKRDQALLDAFMAAHLAQNNVQ
jgi:tRNA (guanine37-N1)-methyltransferase